MEEKKELDSRVIVHRCLTYESKIKPMKILKPTCNCNIASNSLSLLPLGTPQLPRSSGMIWTFLLWNL